MGHAQERAGRRGCGTFARRVAAMPLSVGRATCSPGAASCSTSGRGESVPPPLTSSHARVVQRGGRGCIRARLHRCQATRPSGAAPDATAPSPADVQRYQALVSELASLSAQQLRQAAAARSDELLDSRFLFWLRDQERRAGLPGMPGAPGQGQPLGSAELREAAARLGQELTLMREWVEEQANRKLLPSLASSLAYSNLKQWRVETGKQAPQVAKGVDLDQLYRLGEEEEKKLRESLAGGTGGFGSGPRKGPATRSAIEEFTKHNKAYADLAAGAMARVRARLMGYQDDASGGGEGGEGGAGPSAAQVVLRTLLHGMGSTEERATFMPDAFAPPGLQIPPEAEGGKPSFVVTSPEALTSAIRARLAALSGQTAGAAPDAASAATSTSESTSASAGTSSSASSGSGSDSAVKARWRPGQGRAAPAPAPAPADAVAAPPQPTAPPPPQQQQQPQQQPGALLPCGQSEAEVLTELVELVEEYDRAVYSRKTPLERMGHSSAPWLM
ncbi:hypothetical protein HXX76_007697 [Chlamydomonas incerta]|uniref:Uncharacterized protein n=1 Tax=Chlamydomonas incerta TaxID=51695 RepID=A0A835SWX2_CHLIN|nr:hypothetical protein HXX76_007697 [Chlamydomonas incerta]|eukprot:KAG2434812.1 hypothetical protein HXX76_007697 [Chlamydomonas incerta]